MAARIEIPRLGIRISEESASKYMNWGVVFFIGWIASQAFYGTGSLPWLHNEAKTLDHVEKVDVPVLKHQVATAKHEAATATAEKNSVIKAVVESQAVPGAGPCPQ